MIEYGDLQWRESENKDNAFHVEILKQLEMVERGENIKLGFGKTGSVHTTESRSNACLKIVSNKNVGGNDVGAEMGFLDTLSDTDKLRSAGIRREMVAPKPIACLKRSVGNDYLVMETINGFTLRDLVNFDLYHLLPNNFDYKHFFTELNEIVKKMNEGLNIYHRDLSEGNVMVDENGQPVIIDFGDACSPHLKSEDPYRQESSNGKVTIFTNDLVNVQASQRLIGKYLKDKGHFNKSVI